MAADLVAGEAKRLNDELAEIDTQYAIFDTPGQMELFAFRASGPFIFKELDLQQKAILYLFDAPFCSNPLNYASNLFLAATVYNRFTLPQPNLLSKTDLLPKARVNETLSWRRKPEALANAITEQLTGTTYLLTMDLVRAVSRLRLDFSLVPCSAKNLDNFVNLHAALLRLLRGGEEQ